jgi:twitching motility protein PilT
MTATGGKQADALFEEVVRVGASDLHVVAGRQPYVRIDGALVAMSGEPWNAKQTKDFVGKMLTLEQQARFEHEKDLDFAHETLGGDRFRVNVHWEKGVVGLAARRIPNEIPDVPTSGLTPEMEALTDLPNGLVLITGPAGCGKSTTLATMVNAINRSRAANIFTLEDPIEFVFPIAKSLVRQREVGVDANSFPAGLKHLLRQDPNVIVVGEMRDLETIATTVTLAETGHLVFATLHTNNASSTIERLIDAFPAEQQTQIRTQLALSLRAIISQQLVPKVGGGRVAVREFLLNTPAVANLIRENKPEQLPTIIQTSARLGMQTFEQDAKRLLGEKVISAEIAARFSGKGGK